MSAISQANSGDEPPNADARYRVLFESMSEGFLVCEAIRDAAGRLTDYWIRDANPAFQSNVSGALVGRRIRQVRPDVSEEWLHTCERVLARGKPARFEYQDPVSLRWFDVHVMRMSDHEMGQFYFDITHRKRAEAHQVELFNELNHRVKNNLTIVSAMLSMQARNAPQPEVQTELLKAVARIQSIADVHSSLYRSSSQDQVDVQSYLSDLCSRLAGAMLADDRIRLEVDAHPVSVDPEQAVTLGIIVNELVTNAVKHAYPADQGGVVHVGFAAAEAALEVVVTDYGPGIIDGLDGPASGLGMRLVRSLVQRAGGSLSVSMPPGATFKVSLPRPVAGDDNARQRSLL
jgi:two-component sensor histidine kinase